RRQLSEFVTTRWPTNINVVPIDYAFRPRLRDRLTLRRLTLRRNPWTFGDSVFHTVCRYSCQHSHFSDLHRPSQVRLRRLSERSPTATRSQRSGTTDQYGPSTSSRGPAACVLSGDTHLAIARSPSDRRIPNPSSISPRPASRLLNQSPSEDSA